MPDPKTGPALQRYEIGGETQKRIDRLAADRGQSPAALLNDALTQYLEREEKGPAGKKYPRRTPVGGIITPF